MTEKDSETLIGKLNWRAQALLESQREYFEPLGIVASSLGNGAEVLNFGWTTHSGAGDLLAKVCMADLGHVCYVEQAPAGATPPRPEDWSAWVNVETDYPLIACMAAQYAGWPLSVGDYFAMCSGPARLARGKEKVLEEYKMVSASDQVVVVLESGKLPDEAVAQAIADECNVSPERVLICIAPTSSLSGTIQIVARSVETAIHKLHELDFDLNCIKQGRGEAPAPPIQSDDLVALGWTNDAVLYGAVVELTVDCDDSVIEEIGPRVPSNSSSDFGTPFLETFERFERDFYKIDKMLFSPAKVIFKNTRTGSTFAFGEQRFDILEKSWKDSGEA